MLAGVSAKRLETDCILWPPPNPKAAAKKMIRDHKAAAERLTDALVSLLRGTDRPVQFSGAQKGDIEAFKKAVRKNEVDYQKQVWAAFDHTVFKEVDKQVAECIEKLKPGLLAREKEAQERKTTYSAG